MSTSFAADLQETTGSTFAGTPNNGSMVGGSTIAARTVVGGGPGGTLWPNAIDLDGTDDAAAFGNIAGNSNAYTYYLWARQTSAGQDQYSGLMYSRGTGCGIHFPASGTSSVVGYAHNGQSITWLWALGPSMPVTKWCLVAVTVQSGDTKAYVIEFNGTNRVTNVATHTGTFSAANYAQNLYVGADSFGGTRGFNGRVAGARIDNTVLSQAALEAYFDLALPSNSVAPAVTGTLEVGSSLSCTSGTWTNGTISYQWYSNTTASTSGATLLSGQTASTYTLTAADVATKYFFCAVKATSEVGAPVVNSNIVGPVPLKVIEANVANFNIFNSLVTTSTNLATATLTKPEFDWSGISWKGLIGGVTPSAACNIACILISNTHAIGSSHCGPTTGDTIDFRNPAGTVYTYTVAATTNLGADFKLVRFSTTPHASLKRMPFLTRQHWFTEFTRNLWMLEWSGAVGVAVPGSIHRNAQFINLGAAVASSGKPSLAVFNDNTLALVGIHHYSNLDERFTEAGLALIAAAIVSYGEVLTYIPVPQEADRPIVDGNIPLHLSRNRWR